MSFLPCLSYRLFLDSLPLTRLLLLFLPQYGIVVDAGSSHSALYIYKWPADKQNGTGLVTQHQECHVKGKVTADPSPLNVGKTQSCK